MQAEHIWIDKDSRMVNFEAIRNQPDIDGTQHPYGLNAAQLTALGYQEITIYEKPDDYSDETHYRTEQEDAPYVVYSPKSPEQLVELAKNKIRAEIATIEAGQGRALREAALGDPTYLRQIDDRIKALRAQL